MGGGPGRCAVSLSNTDRSLSTANYCGEDNDRDHSWNNGGMITEYCCGCGAEQAPKDETREEGPAVFPAIPRLFRFAFGDEQVECGDGGDHKVAGHHRR